MSILQSNLFTPYTHPESGVTSYILTEKAAPVQQGFYFVNDSMTRDGRYLWFYCAFPPSRHTLGVLDLQSGTVTHYRDTQYNGASPYVDVDTGWIYWSAGSGVWKRGPQPEQEVQPVGFIPAELIGNRQVGHVATHLTRSADGREFFLDAGIGLKFVFGSLDIETGAYEHWYNFDRCHNHAQFSPTDPDLILFAEEYHGDPVTGLTFRVEDRMWLMRRGEQPRPVFSTPKIMTHEWWDAGGDHVWSIDPGKATWRINIHTEEVDNLAWPDGSWHSHNHTSGKYIVGDTNEKFYRGCPSTVRFLNRETGKDVLIATNPEMHNYVGANYHIDPHPRFVGNDEYVVYTTTVRGEVDVALIPTADLIARTE